MVNPWRAEVAARAVVCCALCAWPAAAVLAAEPPLYSDTETTGAAPPEESAAPEPAPKSPDSKPKLGLQKLDKKSRAKALAALAGLIILGFGMVALTWLGARVTRRYMNPAPFDHQRRKNSAPPPDDWAKKPLVPGGPEPDGGPP